MGNQLKKTNNTNNKQKMFKSFASAIALLAIGAYASWHEEKPTAAGGIYSKA